MANDPSTGSTDHTTHIATSADELILISVDDHIAEPADMFDAHVPDKYKEYAPRVVDEGNGAQQWYYGEIRGRNLGLNAVAGKPPELFNVNPNRYEDMRPGCYDVDERVRDMSAGGQLAGLNFPNWTGFAGQVLQQGPDRDVNLVMVKAYNDWHVDEWCGAHPDRFIPCGVLPLWDVEECREGDRPSRRQGLPRGRLLGESCPPRHAEHPHRRVGSAVRRGLRPRDGARVPHRLVVEVVDDHRRRPARRGHDPLLGHRDLHARRPALRRLLEAVPEPEVLAH